MDRAAGSVAAQLRQVQRLGDDALARERGVAVEQDRQHRERRAGEVDAVLLGAGDALEHRVDGLEVARVGGEVDLRVVALIGDELALGAEVVLDVTGALHRVGSGGALELAEDLAVRLARDVGEHVETATVRHADRGLFEAGVRGLRQDAVKDRDDGLATFEAEALLADELRLQERLERLGLVELAQDALLLVRRRLRVRLLQLVLHPGPLLGVLDVHVLDADRAAVRVTQDAEDLAQLEEVGAAETARGERAVEIPQRQAVARDVEVGVTTLLVLERVGVGHEVTAHAVGVDELLHARDLVDVVVVVGGDVLHPAHRLVGDAQRLEDLVVEVVLTEQQLVDLTQELPGRRTLDDAVVVGRGDRQDLADGVAVERLLARALPFGGVVERADTDDGARALHQTRHRVHRADATGVGQRDRRARVVLERQLVVARLLDHLFVRGPELRERHRLGALDRRHDERARTVGLLQVDGEAEVDVPRLVQDGLALLVDREGSVHLRHDAQRLDDGVADDVGEAHLAAAAAGEVRVDDDAVVDQRLRRDGADRRRGRDLDRGLHVLHDLGGDALERGVLVVRRRHVTEGAVALVARRRQRCVALGLLRVELLRLALGGARRLGGLLCRRLLLVARCLGGHRLLGSGSGLRARARRGRGRGGRRRGVRRARLIGREELLPCGIHGVLVLAVLLEEFLDEPLVRAEVVVLRAGGLG